MSHSFWPRRADPGLAPRLVWQYLRQKPNKTARLLAVSLVPKPGSLFKNNTWHQHSYAFGSEILIGLSANLLAGFSAAILGKTWFPVRCNMSLYPTDLHCIIWQMQWTPTRSYKEHLIPVHHIKSTFWAKADIFCSWNFGGLKPVVNAQHLSRDTN